MKLKKYLFILLSLLYFDLIFNLFSYDNYLRESIMNISLFCLINSFIIYIFTSIWNKRVNRIVTYIIYSILPLWYGLYYVFYNLLLTPFSVALFRQTDQALQFSENIIMAILENIHVILLFFVPLILFIIFRNKLFRYRLVGKNILVFVFALVISIGIYFVNILFLIRAM